jgi:annexin A7/11
MDFLIVEPKERQLSHPFGGVIPGHLGSVAEVHNNIASPPVHTNPMYQNAPLNMGTPANFAARGVTFDAGANAVIQPQHLQPLANTNALTMFDPRRQVMAPFIQPNMQPPIGTPAGGFRRQSFSTPIVYQPPNPTFGGLSPLGEFDDEYVAIPAPLARTHRSSAPMMMGAPAQYFFLRPYSYPAGPIPYPHVRVHVEALIAGMHNPEADMSTYIDILTKRTPEEMEALRLEFFRTTQTQLYVVFNNLLDANEERESVKYAFMGLVLGPTLFDLWLLQDSVHVLFHAASND